MTNRQLQENLMRYDMYLNFCRLNKLSPNNPDSLKEYLEFEKEEA